MANYHHSLLLLSILTLTTTTSTSPTTGSPTPAPSTTAPEHELQLKWIEQQQQQLNNIVDALVGAGDFRSWINVLSLTDSSLLPLSATFFIPLAPNSTTTTDLGLIPYHIVPQRLSFKDLRVFKPLSLLPTLLPNKYILITNNSASHFTLDDSILTHPDLFTTTSIAVHGVSSPLNYSLYGDPQTARLIEPPPLFPLPRPPPPPPPSALVPLTGELVDDQRYHERKTSAGFRLFGFSFWFFGVGFLLNSVESD